LAGYSGENALGVTDMETVKTLIEIKMTH